MTIAADCRHIDSSGIGVYIRECLPFFLNSGRHFLLLGDCEKLQSLAAGHTNAEIIDCGIKPFSPAELLFFPKKIISKINRCDYYYSPYFNIPGGVRVPVYTTIHDIIFPDMPDLAGKAGLMARMWFYRRAFARSQKIFTVSEFSKSRIEYYSRRKIPVAVTHSAIQMHLLQNSGAPVCKKEYILFIGNIKKHKGLQYLLEAFFRAREAGLRHRLVIVGDKNNFRSGDAESLVKLEYIDASIVEFTGHISNSQLKALLAEAALLVQPSLYEGFGLPPLEAMALGTRALVSDIPVFKEIYSGFPVVFFRTGDAGDLKNKLMELLYRKEPEGLTLSEELIHRYTFEKTASVILRELE